MMPHFGNPSQYITFRVRSRPRRRFLAKTEKKDRLGGLEYKKLRGIVAKASKIHFTT